jgi:hypothetical protein
VDSAYDQIDSFQVRFSSNLTRLHEIIRIWKHVVLTFAHWDHQKDVIIMQAK